MGKHEAPVQQKSSGAKHRRAESPAAKTKLRMPEIKMPELPKLSELPKPDWSKLRGALESLVKIGIDPARSGAHQRSYAFDKNQVFLTAGAAVLFFLLWLLPTGGALRFILYLLPLLMLGFYTALDAVGELLDKKIPGRNQLVCVSAIGLLVLGQPRSAVFIMLMFRLLLLLEAYLFEKKASMRDQLQNKIPGDAVVETETGLEHRPAKSVLPDEVVFVPVNDVIPLDGIVIDGVSSLDASALTGAAATVDVGVNSRVFAGLKNLTNPLKIRVTNAQESSTASRVVSRVKHAADSVSSRMSFLDHVLSYLPIALTVLGLLLIVVVSLATRHFRLWIYRGIFLLVLAAFGDLLISGRMAYFTGFFDAAKEGVLFRDADAVDRFSGTDLMVFSKTGTVTEGRYTVAAVYPVDYEEKDLLTIAALAECQSTHPIARALREACGIEIHHRSDITLLEETPGRGIHTLFGGRNVYVGNSTLLIDHNISFDIPSHKGTVVHVAVDNKYAGCIVLNDRVRDNAFDAIEELRLRGVRAAVMLTGDVQSMARPIASSLNFDMVKCELSNEAKMEALQYLKDSKGNNAAISYVSSKAEDLELLKAADVGVAFSALTADAPMDSASVLIQSGVLLKLPDALFLAKRICFAAVLDIAIVLGVSLALLVLGLTGTISVWLASLLCLLVRVGTLIHAIHFK